jgi:hypothetical protein
VTSNPRGGGLYALRLLSTNSAVYKVYQEVADIEANTTYTVHFRVYKAADPGTDWAVSARLVDASGTAIAGPNSYSNVATSAAAGALTADWANPVTGTFVTPKTLPEGGVFLEIVFHQSGDLTVAPANAADAYVAHVCLHESDPLYAGGPGVNCYSGITEGAVDDTRTATVALSAGVVSTYLIRGIDRLLGGGLASADVRIPTATGGSITQADALVS